MTGSHSPLLQQWGAVTGRPLTLPTRTQLLKMSSPHLRPPSNASCSRRGRSLTPVAAHRLKKASSFRSSTNASDGYTTCTDDEMPSGQSVRSSQASKRRIPRRRHATLAGLRAGERTHKTYHRNGRGNDPMDYEEKYKEDPIYKEVNPNARVWRMYLDESQSFDAEVVDDARDTVDVLLVFAGLFSAVVTAFIMEIISSLDADMGRVTAFVLYDMYAMQAAYFNGTFDGSMLPAPPSPTEFTPPPIKVVINGLWFASLALSLITALIAVLVKQWLHHYMSIPSGTPRDRALARQYRFDGFQKWRVPFIVGIMPFLMLLSLAIFFLGLILLVYSLSVSVAVMLAGITSVAYIGYAVSIILPVCYSDCPYQTPLSKLFHILLRRLLPKRFFPSTSHWPSYAKFDASTIDHAVRSLHWLFSSSVNPSVRSVILQSLGGIPRSGLGALQRAFSYEKDFSDHFPQLISEMVETAPSGNALKLKEGNENRLERVLRSTLIICGRRGVPRINLDHSTGVQLRAVLSAHSSSFPAGGLHPSEVFSSTRSVSLHPVVWEHILRLPNAFPAFLNQHSVDLEWWNSFIPYFQPPPVYKSIPESPLDTLSVVPFTEAIHLCRLAVNDAFEHLVQSLETCCTKTDCAEIVSLNISPWHRFLLFVLNHTTFHTLLSKRQTSGAVVYSRTNTLLIVRSLECLWQGLHGLSGHNYSVAERLSIFNVTRKVMGAQILTDSFQYPEVESLGQIRGLTIAICAELGDGIGASPASLWGALSLLPPPTVASKAYIEDWLSASFIQNLSRTITSSPSRDCSKAALDFLCQCIQYGLSSEISVVYDELLYSDFIRRTQTFHACEPVKLTIRSYVFHIHRLIERPIDIPTDLHIAHISHPDILTLACAVLSDSSEDIKRLAEIRKELRGPALTVSQCVSIYTSMDATLRDEAYMDAQLIPRGDPYEWLPLEEWHKKLWKASMGTVAVRFFANLRGLVEHSTWLGPQALDPAFWDPTEDP